MDCNASRSLDAADVHLGATAAADPKQKDPVHSPLAVTSEERASSEERSSDRGVSIEALQLLSQLDEQKLIQALESEDIRLGRRLLAQTQKNPQTVRYSRSLSSTR